MSACNQRIRLHQDQAALMTCLSYVELKEIIDCLRVCQYWYQALSSSRVGWFGCTFTFDRQFHLAPKYHPFIRQLRITEGVGTLKPNALAAFTHLTSIELKHSFHAPIDWDLAQPNLETVFGLLNTTLSTSPPIHYSRVQSFHLDWHRNQVNIFPLQKLLEHPRFRSLSELSLKGEFQPEEAIRAIRELKELRKLTCRVPLRPKNTDVNDHSTEWTARIPNLILFEVMNQLPLLHTLSVSEIPEGIDGPLPSTITDLTINELPLYPSRLYPALDSLTELKSFTFGIVTRMSDPHWIDWIKWLNQITTFEFVHIDIGIRSGRDPNRKWMELVSSFVLNNSSQLSICSVKCDRFSIDAIEFDRSVVPPSDTDLPPGETRDIDVSYLYRYIPIQFEGHPLKPFRDWRTKLRPLRELRLVNIPVTPFLINCLSHLSSTSKSTDTRLEHFELDVDAESIKNDPPVPRLSIVPQFCKFLGQQTQLRTLILQDQWIHDFGSELGDALGQCHQLRFVQLNTGVEGVCEQGRCSISLAQSLAQLPHLTHLHLIGSCLVRLAHLTLFVTSNSLRQLDCVLLGQSNTVVERLRRAQFLIIHPHIQTTINGLSPRQTIAAATATTKKKPGPPSSKKPGPTSSRGCLIQ